MVWDFYVRGFLLVAEAAGTSSLLLEEQGRAANSFHQATDQAADGNFGQPPTRLAPIRDEPQPLPSEHNAGLNWELDHV